MTNPLNDKEILQEVLASVPDIIIVISEHGRYLGFGGISEFNMQALVGKHVSDLFPSAISELFLTTLQEAFAQKDHEVRGMTYKISPGPDLFLPFPYDEEHWFETKIKPLSTTIENDRIAVCICRDITDKYHYEQELIRLSERDFLTGIYNRAKWVKRLTSACDRFQRYHNPLSILLFDIDRFKSINDTYGHPAGDLALCHVVNLVDKKHRVVDTFARMGGDEFAMILPDTDINEAYFFAQRLNKLVAQTPFHFENTPITLTTSIGISQMLPEDNDISSIIARADKALYQSKYRGRDCATICTGEEFEYS